MKSLKVVIGGVCACLIASAQVPVVRPQVAGRAVQEGQVTVGVPGAAICDGHSNAGRGQFRCAR